MYKNWLRKILLKEKCKWDTVQSGLVQVATLDFLFCFHFPMIQWIFCSRSKLPFEVLTIVYYRNYLKEEGSTSCFKCSKLRVQYLYHHAAPANPWKKQAISPDTLSFWIGFANDSVLLSVLQITNKYTKEMLLSHILYIFFLSSVLAMGQQVTRIQLVCECSCSTTHIQCMLNKIILYTILNLFIFI